MNANSIPNLILVAFTLTSLYDRVIDRLIEPRPTGVALSAETDAALAPTDGAVGEHLAKLAGCFAVRYQFVEDGRGDFFFDDGVEYMDVAARGHGYIARNYLILDEHTTFLHWTQEWTPLGRGQWLLTVRSGDGSLRYQSRGAWRFNQWEGEAALAAKPNRDILRTDYDQLERRNIIQLTEQRWIQSEVNRKLLDDGTPVASEVGWITYTRRESDEACAAARESLLAQSAEAAAAGGLDTHAVTW